MDAQRKAERESEAAKKKEEEKRRVFEESARKWKERQANEQRKSREKATEQPEKVASLNDGIRENPVAKRLKSTAEIIGQWAERVYRILIIIAIIELVGGMITGIALGVEWGFGALAISFGSAIVLFVLSYIEAVVIRFIMNCIALKYRAKAEIVQNTFVSANIALYEANKKTNE